MSDTLSLLQQIANRTKKWHSTTGISQSTIAHAIGTDQSNYSAFLAVQKRLECREYLPVTRIRCATKAGGDSEVLSSGQEQQSSVLSVARKQNVL
jgi:hypothetical protein